MDGRSGTMQEIPRSRRHRCRWPRRAVRLARSRNLADQLESAGLSWRSYQDGTDTPCFHGPYTAGDTSPDPYQGHSTTGAKNYADRHNPFIYFPDIIENQGRCDSHVVPYTDLATDIAGDVQPSMTDPRIANKRTYWESNGQITRRVQLA